MIVASRVPSVSRGQFVTPSRSGPTRRIVGTPLLGVAAMPNLQQQSTMRIRDQLVTSRVEDISQRSKTASETAYDGASPSVYKTYVKYSCRAQWSNLLKIMILFLAMAPVGAGKSFDYSWERMWADSDEEVYGHKPADQVFDGTVDPLDEVLLGNEDLFEPLFMYDEDGHLIREQGYVPPTFADTPLEGDHNEEIPYVEECNCEERCNQTYEEMYIEFRRARELFLEIMMSIRTRVNAEIEHRREINLNLYWLGQLVALAIITPVVSRRFTVVEVINLYGTTWNIGSFFLQPDDLNLVLMCVSIIICVLVALTWIYDALVWLYFLAHWSLLFSYVKRALLFVHYRFRYDVRIKARMDSSLVRREFRDTPIPNVKPTANHTHGRAAAERSAASLFMDLVSRQLGSRAYFYQCSNADVAKGRLGSRDWHFVKDLVTSYKVYRPPSDSVICMVDVDQYIDMPTFLQYNHHPVILYTFQPSAVSRVGEDYSFTFVDNEVHYTTAGGAKYVHKVWNYGVDCFMVQSWKRNYLFHTNVYNVERVKTGQDREIVLLAPTYSWYGNIQIGRPVTGDRLVRLEPLQTNGHNRLKVLTKDTVQISTGVEGNFSCATIDAEADDAIRVVLSKKSTTLTLSAIKGLVGKENDHMAASLYSYFSSLPPNEVAPVVCPVDKAVRHYTFGPRKIQDDSKNVMVAFMSPVLHNAFVPVRSLRNEVESINKRVLEVRSKELEITDFISTVISEFTDLLVPPHLRHTLGLASLDEVWERQNRKPQRRSLLMSQFLRATGCVSAFLKGEPQQNVKPPRNISTIDAPTKVKYSQVIYSFEKIVKRQPWYAFSRKPAEIAARVVEVCQDKKHVVNSDFSKFDGRVSNILRLVERSVLSAAFDLQYTDYVGELHRTQYDCRGFGSYGTPYDTGTSRLSGSPETSIFNSVDNAFTAFLGWRMTKENGAFVTAPVAWSRLGVYGGDDGLTGDLDVKTYIRAAESLGQLLTTEVVLNGHRGVAFLARKYSPEVWHGCMDSICDVKRQLSKFHVTMKMPSNVTPVMKLIEKLRCIYLTDKNTPILGLLARRAKALNGGEFSILPRTSDLTSWVVRSCPDEALQYPNVYGDWMLDEVDFHLPDFDHKMFEQAVTTAPDLFHLLNLPICDEPTLPDTKEEVSVDGDIFPMSPYGQLETKSYPAPSVVAHVAPRMLSSSMAAFNDVKHVATAVRVDDVLIDDDPYRMGLDDIFEEDNKPPPGFTWRVKPKPPE